MRSASSSTVSPSTRKRHGCASWLDGASVAWATAARSHPGATVTIVLSVGIASAPDPARHRGASLSERCGAATARAAVRPLKPCEGIPDGAEDERPRAGAERLEVHPSQRIG
jgi:hypothetical protein